MFLSEDGNVYAVELTVKVGQPVGLLEVVFVGDDDVVGRCCAVDVLVGKGFDGGGGEGIVVGEGEEGAGTVGAEEE